MGRLCEPLYIVNRFFQQQKWGGKAKENPICLGRLCEPPLYMLPSNTKRERESVCVRERERERGTLPHPNHPATSPPPPPTPPPPCGMRADVCLKEALCAWRKTHSCAAERLSCVYIVKHTQTDTHTRNTHHSHRWLLQRLYFTPWNTSRHH